MLINTVGRFVRLIVLYAGIVVAMQPARCFPFFTDVNRSDDFYRSRVIERELERFLSVERSFIQRGLFNMSKYIDIVKRVFKDYNLPEDFIYLPIIESAYSPRAYSRAGAAGIWQFMKSTAREYGLKVNFWVDERRDPEKSTVAAARHLRDLFAVFKNWDLALAAYNAGIGRIKWAIRKSGTRNYWAIVSKGILNRETARYVPRFYASLDVVKNYDRYGFKYIDNIDNGFKSYKYKYVVLDCPVDITIVSAKAGIKLKGLKFLNPELRRLITPPGRNYKLRVPAKKYAKVISVCKNIPPQELIDVREYTVKSGETLGEISERFKVDISLLKRVNNIKNPRRIRAGQNLIIPVNNKNKNLDFSAFKNTKYYFNDNLGSLKSFYTQEINYRVVKGDNLWNIAKKFGIDVEMILAANGLNFNSIIRPGDTIVVWIDLPFIR